MVTISLVALLAYVFGAFAYGSAFLLSLRQAAPVWASPSARAASRTRGVDGAGMTLFAFSSIWFVVCAGIEFRTLAGTTGLGLIDVVGRGLTFGFPPLIMHTLYNETRSRARGLSAAWTWLLGAMYVVSFGVGLWVTAMLLRLVPPVPRLGAVLGLSVGGLFLLCTLYCVALMMRQDRPLPPSTPERQGRTAMFTAFGVMTLAIFALTFLREYPGFIAVVERAVRGAPLLFLMAATYFEHRFEFYDLVVKRGVTLVASLIVVGAALAVVLPWFEHMPSGVPRPWLLAVVLMPLAMLLPWMHAQIGRLLDLVWFGRHYTPAEAVRVLLAALQRATDEASLLAAAEAGFLDVFHAEVRLHTAPPPGVDREIVLTVAGAGQTDVLWIAARDGAHLLSEDLALLRSLGTVVAYLLENMRLHERRKGQEQLEQELRLQTSRSELKALRAQINPHFLFNALNAIASLIHTDPGRADSAVEQLAEVFRYTLRRSESEWAPLDQELAFVQAYLDVEEARFGTRLQYTIDADPKARGTQVPSMVLHTLVENAVKHGISAQRGSGRILVRTRLTGGRLRLEVHDTGPGPSAEAAAPLRANGERFGLRSIRDRLEGHYGHHATFTLGRDEAAGMTVAAVEMPLSVAEPRQTPAGGR
jgi:signal transduction histidine kinase